MTQKFFPNPQSFLALPNLHINFIENKSSSYIRGVCLDFGFFATQYDVNEKNKRHKITLVSKQIVKMAKIHLQNIIDNNNFKNLFANRIPNEGQWEYFSKQDNQQHIELLRESYKKLQKRPEENDFFQNLLELHDRILDVKSKNLDKNELVKKLLDVTIAYQYPKVDLEKVS